MSDAAYIDECAAWSKELTRLRSRGPGDLENAMRSIERDHNIDYWLLWQLRYTRHRLKSMSVSVYVRLRAAYQAECERQMRKLQHEIEITKQVAGPDHPVVVETEALVDAANGKKE